MCVVGFHRGARARASRRPAAPLPCLVVQQGSGVSQGGPRARRVAQQLPCLAEMLKTQGKPHFVNASPSIPIHCRDPSWNPPYPFPHIPPLTPMSLPRLSFTRLSSPARRRWSLTRHLHLYVRNDLLNLSRSILARGVKRMQSREIWLRR